MATTPPPLAALAPGDLIPQLRANVVDATDWVRVNYFEALLGIGAAVLLYLLFIGLRIGLLKVIGARSDVTTWRGLLGRVVRRTRTFFLTMLSAQIVVHALNPPAGLVRTVEILFIIGLAVQAAYWLREIVMGAVERRAGLAATEAGEHDGAAFASAVGIIKVLVNVVVWSLALILILSNLGVNVTGLVAGLGVGGIAIGLAAQGIFADLFAALSILFDRPFKVGDSISFDGVDGTVEAIGLKTTRIRALSGEQVIVSNKNLLDKNIANLRRIQERRVQMPLGLICQTSVELLERVPAECEAIVNGGPQARFSRCHFIGFGASSLDFMLVFHVSSPDFVVMMDERHRVGLAILKRFAELGIEFAYPSQVSFAAGRDGRIVDPQPLGGFIAEEIDEEREAKPRPRAVRG